MQHEQLVAMRTERREQAGLAGKRGVDVVEFRAGPPIVNTHSSEIDTQTQSCFNGIWVWCSVIELAQTLRTAAKVC